MALSEDNRESFWRLAPFTFAALLFAGCLANREVIPVSYNPEDAKPSTERIANYEQATKAIARALVEELALPRIETVLIVFPSLQDFQSGMVTELGFTESQAASRTDLLAIASCRHKKVLANSYGLSRQPWSSRIKTLAHEMTHIAQYELAESHCSFHYWMAEGFADWAAYKVLGRLKLDTFARGKESFIKSVATLRYTRTLPTLNQISSAADWDYMGKSLGVEATYGQSFLAVDWLIEQQGLPAVVEYFKLFGHSNDRDSNFATAFGKRVAAFDQEFSAHLKKLLT
jgi:hypothetical protein